MQLGDLHRSKLHLNNIWVNIDSHACSSKYAKNVSAKILLKIFTLPPSIPNYPLYTVFHLTSFCYSHIPSPLQALPLKKFL